MQTERIPLEVRTEVVNRLRRAAGQLQAVARMLEEGGDCEAVLRQLTAGRNAVGRAGVRLLSAGLLECVSAPQADDLVPERFEKLFMELS